MGIADSGPVTMRLRIAVIDAQPMFRAGVAHTLRGFKSFETIVEGATASDALQIAGKQPIDLMLIDLNISGDGAKAVASIARLWPGLRIIVLTTAERAEDVTTALQNGARGYVLKDVTGPELYGAIQSVSNGDVYLSPALGARLIAQSVPQARTAVGVPALQMPESGLTPREDQILSQVSVGATNKEIARALNLSEKTVKYYMTNIMQKLQARNRVEAVLASRRIKAASALQG